MSKRTILIVEDNAAVIAAYLHLLDCVDNLEVTPLVAISYKKARQLLSKEPVDLIILDLVLPDVQATDILGELRREHPQIPIILVTAYADRLELERSKELGVTHFFIKPGHLEPFGLAVQRSLQAA
jgi:response regulator of citrate/malate metabolism